MVTTSKTGPMAREQTAARRALHHGRGPLKEMRNPLSGHGSELKYRQTPGPKKGSGCHIEALTHGL